jgi:ubiquinone/menaquinone biosynthesis C-methylase UbiE
LAQLHGIDQPRDVDVARFGRWAESYDESILQRLIFAPLQEFTLAQAAAVVPAPAAVLDVGCGTGLLLRQAARRFPTSELTGVDASQGMIDVALASLPPDAPVHFLHAFAESLPFPDASFDLVVTTMSFHHWTDQPAALREVRRVLVPGGVFALTDALPVGLLRWAFVRRGHGRFNVPAALEQMLSDAALRVERFVAVPRFGGTLRVVIATRPEG